MVYQDDVRAGDSGEPAGWRRPATQGSAPCSKAFSRSGIMSGGATAMIVVYSVLFFMDGIERRGASSKRAFAGRGREAAAGSAAAMAARGRFSFSRLSAGTLRFGRRGGARRVPST